MTFQQLVPILQAAVSPVVMISGVGLLILSMTNRLARVVDRSRQLGTACRNAAPADLPSMVSQLATLVRRARMLRRAIRFAALCVLMAALLVIVLFLSAYLGLQSMFPAVALFILCLGSLIVALISFIQDINLSLAALDTELAMGDRR